MPNSSDIKSPYTSSHGLSILINDKPIQLSVADICYLLLNVDGLATIPSVEPSNMVEFSLHSVHYQFTDNEWSVFKDALESVASSGGWSHTACKC